MSSEHKYIVMEGNPFDGYTFYGPFNDIDLANDFGDRNCVYDWFSVRLNPVPEGGYYWSDEAKSYIAEKGKMMSDFPEHLIATKAIKYEVADIVDHLKNDAESEVTMEDVLLYVEQLVADDFKYHARFDDVMLIDEKGEEY